MKRRRKSQISNLKFEISDLSDFRFGTSNWIANSVSIAFLLLIGSVASAEDWPQFRGPNASGVSASKQALPTTFSTAENLAWSAKIGDGIGSPIVVQGKVYVTAMTGDEK